MERVIDCQMLIVSLIQLLICPPTIRDHQGSRLDPCFNKTKKCPYCSILNSNNKTTFRITFHPTKDPLSLNKMTPLKLPLLNFRLINFDNFPQSLELLRMGLNIINQYVSGVTFVVSNGMLKYTEILINGFKCRTSLEYLVCH